MVQNYIHNLQNELKMGKQPYRILQVVTIMNRGGIETMIMNHYRTIDRSKYQFDFLVHRRERGDYDDEIEQLGGKIYRAFPIRPWKYPQYFNWLNKFFTSHCKYIAVHAHIQENSGLVFRIARKYRINNLVSTSHTAGYGIDYKYPFRLYAKYYLNKYCTHKMACGKMAGEHLYGKNVNFNLLHNAIDVSKFKYNISIRNRIRQELNIENKFVIGNVARFHKGKNHTFVIDIFKEINNIDKNCCLVLVGDGEELEAIKYKVNSLNLNNNVKFLGVKNNVDEILQAFDVLLFPSLFEGIPVSIIEAQASGLPCILSDTIDPETAITKNVEYHSLNAPMSEWTNAILAKQNYRRRDTSTEIIEAGYDVIHNTEILIDIYHPQNV